MTSSDLSSKYDFDKYKKDNKKTGSFLDSFASAYGFNFSGNNQDDEPEEQAPAPTPSPTPDSGGLNLTSRQSKYAAQDADRGTRVGTQSTNRSTNIRDQDFIRGGQSAELSLSRDIFNQQDVADDTNVNTRLTAAGFNSLNSSNTNVTSSPVLSSYTATSAPVTSTAAGNAIADEINTRGTTALNNATSSDPYDSRPDLSTLDIYNQEDPEDIDVDQRLTDAGIDIGAETDSGIDLSGLATDEDLEDQRTRVDNKLTDVTANDPGVSNLGTGDNTEGLAIYDNDDDTNINVGERLADLEINPGESQYTDRIDPGNEIESEIRARQDRQEEAYQDAVENDPSDSQRGITDPSDGYNPPSDNNGRDYDGPGMGEISHQAMLPGNPGFDRQYQEWLDAAEDAPEDQTDSPTWEERWNDSYMDDREPTPSPDPGDDLGIGDEVNQREPTRVTRDSNSGTPHPDGHTGALPDPINNEPSPIAQIEAPPEDNVTNAINLISDGDQRGAWNMLRRTVGLQDGTDEEWQAELDQRGERERREAEYAARNSETAGRSQTLDPNTMQPIGRQGVVTDETTNAQSEGSGAAEAIDSEAEARNNQQALQSNEEISAGGADTALIRTHEFQDTNGNGTDDRDEQWHQQGFQDEGEMQRFEDKYSNYVKTAQDIGHLNINDTTKDDMRTAFFKVDRPAYEYDQKTKAHNAIIDEAKQRGVDTGVFENVGDVNKWIGRLKKKQAGKYVAYGDESKENYLAENKLDTMMYNKFDGWDQ